MNDSMPGGSKDHPMPGRRARLGYMILAYAATALGVAGVFPTSQDGSIERDQYLLGPELAQAG